MDLTRLLNEPLPPMRSPPLRESPGTREANSVESLSFAAPPSRSEAPRPSEPYVELSLYLYVLLSRTNELFSPLCRKFAPLSSSNINDFVSTSQRSFSDSVLCSTSRTTIETALEVFRVEAHSGKLLLPLFYSSSSPAAVSGVRKGGDLRRLFPFTDSSLSVNETVPDFVQSTNDSVRAVQEAFKSPDSWQGTQQDLWSVWSQITWLTQLARVPTFPIDPDKVALLLSVYVDLPCSKIVRELIRHRQTLLGPDQVLLLLQGLHLAGKASRSYWPNSKSLVRNYSHYQSISMLVSLLRFASFLDFLAFLPLTDSHFIQTVTKYLELHLLLHLRATDSRHRNLLLLLELSLVHPSPTSTVRNLSLHLPLQLSVCMVRPFCLCRTVSASTDEA